MVPNSFDWLGHQPEALIWRLRSLLADLEVVAKNETFHRPDEAAVLENWTVWRRPVPCLIGRVTGHPDIRTGAAAVTSEIYLIDHQRKLARSLSRWYQLDDQMHLAVGGREWSQ